MKKVETHSWCVCVCCVSKNVTAHSFVVVRRNWRTVCRDARLSSRLANMKGNEFNDDDQDDDEVNDTTFAVETENFSRAANLLQVCDTYSVSIFDTSTACGVDM